jgi:anaerobic magnesium-protoporphyrin IX monomethyl ester cyclase
MKILLIASPARKSDSPVFPLGLGYIAADLTAHGHEIHVYDPNVSARDFLPELGEQLEGGLYDAVGVSLRNIDNNTLNDPCYYYLSLAPTLALIRARLPGAKILIGGSGFSIFPKVIMRRHREIDFGVFREGVGVVPRLLDNLAAPDRVRGVYYREGDSVRFSGPSAPVDLDTLPDFPWRHIDLTPYLGRSNTIGILSKSGCAFACAYCTYPGISGNTIRMRAPHLVVDDIERLVQRHGLASFFFVDSIFNYPPEHARAVCEEMLRRQIRIEWRAFFVEKYMDRSLLELAVEAGCACFYFSPDGITNASREALQKVNAEEDVQRVVAWVKECRNARAFVEFMANPPGQNFAGFCRFIRFYASTHLRHPRKFPRVGGWYPRVYPNTPLHARLVAQAHFPETEEGLLPITHKGLKRVFWVNKDNAYVNLMYDLYFLPQKMKGFLLHGETRHEAALFRGRGPGGIPAG